MGKANSNVSSTSKVKMAGSDYFNLPKHLRRSVGSSLQAIVGKLADGKWCDVEIISCNY